MKKIPFVLFLCTLIFAPIAFGTVEQWSLLTVEIFTALAFLLYCSRLEGMSAGIFSIPGLVPLLLLVCWMMIQIVPLPSVIVKILSPQSYEIHKLVFTLLPGDKWMPLTVNQKATALECVRILSYALFYILTIQLLCRGDRLQTTVKVCIWLAIGVAVVAILQKFSSPNKIYWFRVGPSNSSPVGPWIYRSQYCGYIEMILPLALALFLYYRPVVNRDDSLRMRFVAFFSRIGGNLSILLGFGVMVMISSAFISLSRGGILAITVSLLFFFLVLAWKKSRYSKLFYISIFACCVFSIALFGWQPIVERFVSIVNNPGGLNIDRLPIWRDSWRIFEHFWLTGSGFGTFINIFPQYKTIPDNFIYDHAHSDYLELLTDGGIVGFGLAVWFVISVMREGWKMLGQRRDRYSILVSIGALTGISAMLIHSISDFNLHNGADGLYFFFLCGLLVSAGNTRLHYHGTATLLKKQVWPAKMHLLLAGSVFLIVVVFVQGGAFWANLQYQRVKNIYLTRQLAPKYLEEIDATVQQAAKADPLNGIYPFLRGEVARYQGNPEMALDYYLQAAVDDPLDGAFLQRVALLLPKDKQHYAEVLMEKATERTLQKNDLVLSQVQWLLEIGKREKAIETLKKALAGNPQFVGIAIPMLQSFSFTREEVVAVLPETVDAWVRYATYLEQTDASNVAGYFYEHSLDFLKQETKFKAEWFQRIYLYFKKRNETEKAVEVLRQGSRKTPNYAPFHIWLGDYYSQKGIIYRALEEYQQALLLDPNNQAVKNMIENLTKSEGQP